MAVSQARIEDSKGVPSFALPWVELGKLEEREKWQTLAIDLIRSSICSELQGLKRNVSDALTRLPDLKQNVGTKVDASQSKISSLIDEYQELFLSESASQALGEDQRKVVLTQAMQYQAPCGYKHDSIRYIISKIASEDSSAVVEEFTQEEDGRNI